MSIERRLAKLEARATAAPGAPTHAEAMAAWERVRLQVRATFIARVTRAPLPTESEEYVRDRETVRRYRASRGFVALEPGAKERLRVRLERMADPR
jgi:hypothetical protein